MTVPAPPPARAALVAAPDLLPAPALPARPRLRHPALHRAPDVLQFGADPAGALVVDGLTP
ncbi:MAG TPA: hypothetical protein VNP37_08415, partial [Actinomycetospora sp.]|nr:hypothetical protein [Actinomycetospora sp.]